MPRIDVQRVACRLAYAVRHAHRARRITIDPLSLWRDFDGPTPNETSVVMRRCPDLVRDACARVGVRPPQYRAGTLHL